MGQEAEKTKEDAEAQTSNQAESKITKEQPQPTKDQESSSSDDENDLEKWEPAKVKDYVKKLRTENKSYRQRAKGLEDRLGSIEQGLKKVFGVDENEQVDPETKITELTQINQMKDVRLAILETALQSGITGSDNIEYFEFLMGKKLAELNDDEELSDEDLQGIVARVQGNQANTMKNTTIVHEKGKPVAEGKETVSLEQFMKMSVMAKSELFRTNEALYNKLLKDARDKKLFV